MLERLKYVSVSWYGMSYGIASLCFQMIKSRQGFGGGCWHSVGESLELPRGCPKAVQGIDLAQNQHGGDWMGQSLMRDGDSPLRGCVAGCPGRQRAAGGIVA